MVFPPKMEPVVASLPHPVTDATAGSVTIDTPNLTVNNGGTISVTGAGNGGAGNLSINAQSISLENGASLQAEVAATNQGNINLITDFLQLRNNSNITTNASGEATGGNITIDTTNLVAFENSNITANAVEGIGGNIQITANGIFLSPDSQITATSQFGVDGVVQINNPEVDPKNGLIELSTQVLDLLSQVGKSCGGIGYSKDNKFVFVGRGGKPPTPDDLGFYPILQDLGTIDTSVVARNTAVAAEVANYAAVVEPPQRIIEANTWIINEQGNIELVYISSQINAQNPSFTTHECYGNDE